MILKLRMLSDENDNFVRDFEVSHETTLLQLNNFILDAIGYEECMTSFFTADDHWNRLREFTLMDMGIGMGGDDEPMAMESVTLAELVVADYKRLILQFDMIADRAFYIEVVNGSEPNAEFTYPRVAFENATVPDQYDPDKVSSDDGSIFEEMMGDFGSFDEDADYDDEY